MIRTTKSVLLAAILVVIAHSSCWAAVEEVLFDYSTSYGGGFISKNEVGDTIKLSHTAEITDFGAVMQTGSTNGVDDVILRLYTVTNFQSGVPDELIWSGIFDNVLLTRSPTFYSIDVPNVPVPRVFGYTLERATNQNLWLPNGQPNDPDHFGTWGGILALGDDGEWITGRPFTPRAVRITGMLTETVPEPSAIACLIAACGLSLLACSPGRRKKRVL